jgi:hypothetical protein
MNAKTGSAPTDMLDTEIARAMVTNRGRPKRPVRTPAAFAASVRRPH